MMEKKLKIIFIILCTSLLTACTELTGENTGANVVDDQQEYVGGIEAVSAGNKRYLLSGVAENGGNSGHFYRLRFNLPEGEKLIFYFFTNNNFQGGLRYSFERIEGVVNFTMEINDLAHSVELPQFNNEEIIDLDLDIHNDHTDIHLLVWEHNGNHESYEECTFDGGCLYNSEDYAFDIWLGVGRASGTYWGLDGNKNLILNLEGPLAPISDV